MAEESAFEIVQKYPRAWTNGDVDTAMEFVAEGISCRAPGQDFEGKDAYRQFIAGFAPRLTGIEDIAEFADGQRVALFYYPQPAAPAPAPAAALFTVKNGQIIERVRIFARLSSAPPTQS